MVIISVIIVCIFCIGIFQIFNVNAFANADAASDDGIFTGYSNNIDDITMYNATNTYKYIGNPYDVNKADEVTNYRTYNKYYDLQDEIICDVSDSSPQITVITHGLGGNASHWSNDSLDVEWNSETRFEFAYSEASIMTRLEKELLGENNAQLYWAKMNTHNSFSLIDLKNDKNRSGNIYQNTITVKRIPTISKHIIIIFESASSNEYNNIVYEELNYMLSKIVYDVKFLNGGELPKINLIGHSRGGLTNLQYALDHPDLVAGLYSMGTPYFGTDTGSTDVGAGVIGGMSHGLQDIIDRNVYVPYFNRWYNGYKTYYKNINAYALGGYSDTDFLFDTLIDDENKFGLVKNHCRTEWLQAIKWVLKSAPTTADVAATGARLVDYIFSLNRDIDYDEEEWESYAQILADVYHFDDNSSFWDNLVHSIRFVGCPYFMNDLLVDLPSQVGVDKHSNYYRSYGFEIFTKKFTSDDYLDNGKIRLSSAMPAVVHNLEAQDPDLINQVLKTIDVGANRSGFLYGIKPDGTAEIYAGTGSIFENSCITIPDEINGVRVTSIADYTFMDRFVYGNVDTVFIPASIKEIGDMAFADCTDIKNIIFEANSALTEIGEYCFSGCENLTAISLPSSLKVINEGAFDKCYSLKRLTVNGTSSLEDISESAFTNSGITDIEINSSNYIWDGCFLIDNNVTDKTNKIAIYVSADATDVKIPTGVGTLGSYLFYCNNNIETVDLNQTKYIGTTSFYKSSVQEIKNTSNIVQADISSFTETPWLNNQSGDFVKIGKVLLSYNGNSEQVVIPEGVERIAENAFYGSNIRSIILPSSIETLGRGVFLYCPNLDWVLLKSTRPPVLDGDCFDSDVTIYVKQTSLNYYLNNIYFKNLDNTISSKNISVTFKDKDGKTLGTKTETYYSTFDKYVSAPSVTGYDFVCWLDPEGNEVYVNNIFTFYNNVILTAYYEPSKYTITLNNGNSNETVVIEYGETVDLDTPYKQGYNFLGWYDSPTGGNQIIDASGKCVWQRTNEVEALYACFSPITYTITYSTARGTFDGTAPTTFTVESPITTANIPEIKEFGYVFDYWKYGGKSFTTTYGIYSNITLTAKWLGTKTTVTSSTTRTINYEYSIVDMSSASYNGTYSYKIASNVKSVVFIGSTSKTFTDMKISVNSRNTALLMGFNNMKFYPKNGSGSDAIYSPYGCELYVSYKGTNRITGARGADGADGATVTTAGAIGKSGKNGQAGGNGINAWKVNLAQFDDNSFITITGGRGGDGGDGSNGQAGANGTRPPNGSIFAPNKGENGKNGGRGGYGGNGGKGGYAIKVYANTYLKTDNDDTYKLIGGRGGNGGKGGKGGAGGAGANDSSANPFTGVGDPGNGGNGGNGGRGGNGGNGSLATNALYVYGTGGAGGTRGVGGKGGAAGAGGDSGTLGADGNDGLPGVIGKNGAYGVAGATGYNTIGTDESIVTIPYLYDKETIADLFS